VVRSNKVTTSRKGGRGAFTLLELLLVMSIISISMAILLPAASKAKRSALGLLSAARQRDTVLSVISYAMDNDERFPKSVAVRWDGRDFAWREPTLLVGFESCCPDRARSISEYLRSYLKDAETMFCPSAPRKYAYLQEAWDSGDNWNHPDPETDQAGDPLFGTYCFFWNYNAFLEQRDRPFRGPSMLAGGWGESKLLVSDYFGYGHWRNRLTYGTRNAYGSCEKFRRAGITLGTPVSSDFWSVADRRQAMGRDALQVKLRAGYTDGRVETFSSSDVLTLRVSMSYDGTTPFPGSVEPSGEFYIPRDAAP